MKRGRKCAVSIDALRLHLNQNAKKIFKDGKLKTASETKVYKKIASQFDKYTPAAVYLQAKRYFKPKQNSKSKTSFETTDFLQSYDRYEVKPQQYKEFNVISRRVRQHETNG